MKNTENLIELIGFIYSSGSGIAVIKGKRHFISYPYTRDFVEEITDEEFANLYYVDENVFFKTFENLVRYLKVLYVNDKYQNKKLAFYGNNEDNEFEKLNVKSPLVHTKLTSLKVPSPKIIGVKFVFQTRKFITESPEVIKRMLTRKINEKINELG